MDKFNKLLEITLQRISELVDWTEKIIQSTAQKAKTLKTMKEVKRQQKMKKSNKYIMAIIKWFIK